MLYTPKEIAFSGRIIMSQNSDTTSSREYFESLFVTRIYEAQYDLLVFKPYKWKTECRYKPYFVGEGVAIEGQNAFVIDTLKGVSVSDRVILCPKSEDAKNREDLGALYKSAADELGM